MQNYLIAVELLEQCLEMLLKATHHDKTSEEIHNFVNKVRSSLTVSEQ